MENTALTAQEVADMLKITKNTVYELIKRGELGGYKVGKKIRVDLAEVERYIGRDATTRSAPKAVETLNYREATSVATGEAMPSGGFIICGQDMLLDVLSRYLEPQLGGTRVLRSYVGSYNGLYSLYKGEVQLATAHIWDGDTDTYNIPYVRRMLPGTPALLVRLATRQQGMYVAKGNPKAIAGWEDFKRSDLTIVNRELGSGTRILLDERLRLMGRDGNEIPGYERECQSHLAVASMVARGGADVGLGNEKTADQVAGVDFIPLQKEQYDLVIRARDADKAPYVAVLEILRSKEFQLEVEGIGGLDLSQMGEIVGKT